MASANNLRRRSDDINVAGLMERGDSGGPEPPQRAGTMPTPPAGQWSTNTIPSSPDVMPNLSRSRWLKAYAGVKASNVVFEQIDEWRRDDPLLGYPSFAEFLGGDERWMMFRRFSSVQARLILEKQDDMRLLEEKLHEMDTDDLAKEPREPNRPHRRLFTRHRTSKEEAEARRKLLKELEDNYLEYERLLSAAHRLNTLPRPAKYEWKSVVAYVRKAKPIIERESDYIHGRTDLVSLRGATEHAHLGAMIERFFNHIQNWTNPKQDEQKDPNMVSDPAANSQKHPSVKAETKKEVEVASEQGKKFSMREWLKGNSAAEKYARALIGMMMLLLVPLFFVVPIYALTKIGNNIGKSIGVLIAFALTFTVVLLTATPARHHEVLGGTATYLAVLVVFFGSLGRG